MKDYLSKDKNYSSFEGAKRISTKDLFDYYKIEKKLSKKEIENLHIKFAKENYLSETETSYHDTPFLLRPENKIHHFIINENDGFLNKKDLKKEYFQRKRNIFIYKNKKILLNRFGQEIKAVFLNKDIVFSNIIYGVKLENEKHYFLFTAILNSKIVNYYIVHKFRKRINSNFSNIDTKILKNIPIPIELNNDIAIKISNISKNLTEGKYEYNNQVTEKLNELIFDLYDLSYLERQRVKDYFISTKAVTKSKNEIRDYMKTLKSSIDIFLKNSVTFESEHNIGLGLLAIKVKLNNADTETLSTKKIGLYLLNEIFEQNPQENFLASREKIWDKDCVYIVKQDINLNWTQTKAYEDGQEILKKLMN